MGTGIVQRLISGVTAFMIRTAKHHAFRITGKHSDYHDQAAGAPHQRSLCPWQLNGDVTGSVAMKKAAQTSMRLQTGGAKETAPGNFLPDP